MTDRTDKRDAIKKHVLALLVSSPVELTVNELKSDYHNFIGEPLDYRGIGYTIIEDFIRDISDAVQIGYRSGMMTLKAKADETTKHIQSLVSKQRVTNKRKYAVYRQRGGGGGGGRPRRGGYQQRRPMQVFSPPPLVPSYLRFQLRDIFKSFPNGIPVTNLENAFARRYGTQIDYRRYGFDNQYDFLTSLKDVLTLTQIENGEWKVIAVGSVSSSQAVHSSNVPVHEKIPIGVTVSPESSENMHGRPSKGRGKRREPSGGSEGAGSVGSAGSRGSSVLDQLETEIQQVLEKFPKGVWASRFPIEFEAIHKKALGFQDHGFLSVVELMSNFINIVTIRRPDRRGDWMLYDIRNSPPDPPQEAVSRSRQFSGRAVEQETKTAIRSILARKQSGIPTKQFPAVYEEYTGMSLPVKELGFDSIDNLFISLADSVLQIAYINEELTLFSVDADISSLQDSKSRTPTPPLSTHPDSLRFPPDVVGPGCHYVPVMLPGQQDYVELYVSNITHPGLFWVFLRHKTKSLALEALMDSLDDAYRHGAEEYKMPENLMVRGQVCATLFPEDNNWHRGVITGKRQTGFVEVYYVDYGNTNFVQKDTIRFLKHDFLLLPAQAIQCRLAHLHPVGTKWKTKTRLRFIELTRERPLIASVHHVKNQVMSLVLIDTNDPQIDNHINDMLVYENLAVYRSDDENPTLLDQKLDNAPDYTNVFGWNHNEAPRLPKVARSQDSGTSVTGSTQSKPEDDEKTYCYIRWVQLTELHIIHVINLDKTAYIVSSEISSFFWDDDILTVMVKKKGLDIEKRLVCNDEYGDLFTELNKYKVMSPQKDFLGTQRFLTLYKLQSVPAILTAFECEDEALITAVNELIIKFDPYSPYWKCQDREDAETFKTTTEDGEEREDLVTNREEEEEEYMSAREDGEGGDIEQEEEMDDNDSGDQQISVEEKQMVLQALQFKRKRILQTMMSDPTSMAEVVNQLHNCEIEITMIKEELELYKGSSSKSENGPQTQRTSPELHTSAQSTVNQSAMHNGLPSESLPSAGEKYPVPNTASIKTDTTQNQSTQHNHSNQSTTTGTGSIPGIMGNMAFAQQQRLINPLLMGQNRVPTAGMGDMSNMFSANLGLLPGLAPMAPNFGADPSLQQNLNPLLMQQQLLQNSLTGCAPVLPLTAQVNQLNLNQLGAMPSIGRGQVLNPTSLGILPGLLPLVENLTQKGAGRGNFSNQ